MLYLIPLILTLSLREKGLSILNLMALTWRIGTNTQSVLLCRVKLASVSNRIFTSPFEKGGLRGIYLKNLP